MSLLRHHRDERRRARLVQVREQERLFARKVREEVKGKREEERRVLEQHLQVTRAPFRTFASLSAVFMFGRINDGPQAR